MTHNIFPVLPIKTLINQYGEQITPQKMASGTKTSVSNLHVTFTPCVVQKGNSYINRKELKNVINHKMFLWYL